MYGLAAVMEYYYRSASALPLSPSRRSPRMMLMVVDRATRRWSAKRERERERERRRRCDITVRRRLSRSATAASYASPCRQIFLSGLRARDVPVYPGSSFMDRASRGIREIIGRDKRKRRPRVLMRLLEREKCRRFRKQSPTCSPRRSTRSAFGDSLKLAAGRMRFKCVRLAKVKVAIA